MSAFAKYIADTLFDDPALANVPRPILDAIVKAAILEIDGTVIKPEMPDDLSLHECCEGCEFWWPEGSLAPCDGDDGPAMCSGCRGEYLATCAAETVAGSPS